MIDCERNEKSAVVERLALARSRALAVWATRSMVVAMLVAGVASASDGVLEINQTCAIETGCFPGDSPGFPVSIRPQAIAHGSAFRLTSDLVVDSANTTAIDIRANDASIHLELGGFALLGPTVCDASCTPTGSGRGVEVSGLLRVHIRNGTIRGFGEHGIGSTGGVLDNILVDVRDVVVESNGASGVTVVGSIAMGRSIVRKNGGRGVGTSGGNASIVEDSVVEENLGNGIEVGPGAVVRGNVVHANQLSGIKVGLGALVHDNAVTDNLGNGIWFQALLSNSTGISVSRNTVVSNGGFGIDAGGVSSVEENLVGENASTGIRVGGLSPRIRANTSYGNGDRGIDALGFGGIAEGNTARGNSAEGLVLGSHGRAQGNTLFGNTGVGVSLGTGTGYLDNVVTNNVGGTVSGGIEIGTNLCGGTIGCP